MTSLRSILIATFAALAITGCNTPSIKEEKIGVQIPAMTQPEYNVGYERALTRNGDPYKSQIIKAENGQLHWQADDGCNWISDGFFMPSLQWNDCSSVIDGKQTVTASGGAWPLKVGQRWSYEFKGTNANGNHWQGKRECVADSATRITVADVAHDTIKVICDDQFSNRTFYISPTIGDFVRYERRRKRTGSLDVYERASTI